MPVPAIDLLRQFDAMVWPMLELVGSLGVANAKLATSRDLLLPRLISGQLSVTEAGNELEVAA
jgi:type I restriction enzyme S subunit